MAASEFHFVYDKKESRDSFFLFLENIFHLYPEKKFHQLITDTVAHLPDDERIYKQLMASLPSIKPFLGDVTYALPALKKQKKEMAQQTLDIVGAKTVFRGCMEIGSTGRYISEFCRHAQVEEPIILVNDVAPTNSIADIFERGQIRKIGRFLPLNNYSPLPEKEVPSDSLDMVTCFIGLHHCRPELLDGFARSIYRVLRPGGFFILRDHDVTSDDMHIFVSLVHTVFNAGTNMSWEFEHNDFKRFLSAEEWSKLMTSVGFKDTGKRILQHKDPSLNTLMGFRK